MKTQIRKFLQEEDGITALEYGILASIVVAVIVAFFGPQLQKLFQAIFDSINGSAGNIGAPAT